MPNPVFITARFRTGSTLLWNIFHNLPQVVSYYEPLHEHLPQMIKAAVPPQPRHFNVDTYFREYPPIKEFARHHHAELGVHNLLLQAGDDQPQLKDYLDYLLAYVAEPKIPVFQFNRVDFRLPWLKKHYPEAAIIHLHRSPRDQWMSTITYFPEDIESNVDADPYLLTTWARDLYLHFPFLAAPYLKHLYQRHYYLWKLSFLAGSRQADLSISYEDILNNTEQTISRVLEVAGVDTAANLEKATSLIVERPLDTWKPYQTDAWFTALEQECEAQLTELRLNQHFGKKPLAKIIAGSPRYQEWLADPQPHRWAVRSSQSTIVKLENIATEKEHVIQALDIAVEERLKLFRDLEKQSGVQEAVLQEKDKLLTAKDELIATQHVALQSKDDLIDSIQDQSAAQARELAAQAKAIKTQAQELVAKENVIQAQHTQLLAKEEVIQRYLSSRTYWLLNSPFGQYKLFRYLVTRSVNFRSMFLPKLGVLHQYPPKPMSLPKKYRSPSSMPPGDWPQISIVTPSYNQADFLERTVESVLNQNYANLQYILQDGASTDGTAALLDNYKSALAHIESRQDDGQAHAVNLGFAKATGEIMAYLNSDDILLPGTLHYVAGYFARHPAVDVVYGHRIIINQDDDEIGRWVLPPHRAKVLSWADYIPQETLFWRRRIWEAAGAQMDESFKFALDWDLLLRFREAGANFVRLPRFLGAFRVHSDQKTTAQIDDLGQQEMARLRARCHGREVTWQEINTHIKPYLRRSVWVHKMYRLGLLRY
ncbi:MAG: glycosyltransferase [Anaerolineae bacterium]|nr:glycosyltransferase [Anaerolineae bacterium]